MTENVSDDLAALYPALKLYNAQVRNDRRLQVPPADSVTVHSAECGSQLTIDAEIKDGRVAQIGYRVRACSLGQASTAIVVNHAVGLDQKTLEHVEKQLRAILAGGATHCEWDELEIFSLIKDVPSRHGSILLPFNALRKIFNRASMALPDTMGASEQ